MASVAKNNIELIQNSISYLHNISNLQVNPPALKCVYLTKAKLMELRSNVQLPPRATGTIVRCQRCFLNLGDGPANYRIKSGEKESKFARRMLVKRDKDKPLTKFQRKYLNRLKPFNRNQLVITCKFCKKEATVKLEKPKKVIASKATKTSSTKKKKKVKKKDKFCGLNEEAVLSLTPENSRNFYAPDFTPLKPNEKKPPKLKLTKKQEEIEIVPKVTKTIIREKQNKLKKKSKLKEFLNSSDLNKSSPSTKLKQFLQNL